MPFEDACLCLTDIFNAILSIERFVQQMNLQTYSEDERTQAAVERKLLVISEAAIRMKDAAETLCRGVPWREIRGIGNWLRHQYDRIDAELIWNTLQDDLPPLKIAVEGTLRKDEPA